MQKLQRVLCKLHRRDLRYFEDVSSYEYAKILNV